MEMEALNYKSLQSGPKLETLNPRYSLIGQRILWQLIQDCADVLHQLRLSFSRRAI